MTSTENVPYGSWQSPVTTGLILEGSLSLGQVVVDGEDIYWAEGRPADKGRVVIMRHTPDGQTVEITPQGYYVRTRAHEYGGAAFTVDGGTVYFSNDYDGRLYRQRPGEEPEPITPAADLRYADFRVDRNRAMLISVREDHTAEGQEAVNTIVSLPLDGGEETVLVEGNSFYSNPRISPDGAKLVWLAWDHPNMPWDGTELWQADLGEDGTVASRRQIAGGAEVSVFQPEWSPDGRLYFVSDLTGWWNLYRVGDGEIEPLHSMQAEFGRPGWVFGLSAYSFMDAGHLVCAYAEKGIWKLGVLDTETLEFQPIATPYTEMGRYLFAVPGGIVTDTASPTEPAAVSRLSLKDGRLGNIETLRRSSSTSLDSGYISIPEAVEFPTEGGRTAHAFFYPPKNKDYRAPEGEKPPLIVISHGGPTSQALAAFNLRIQYWTSRGIGVLDVNYGGSTGFGTEYRRRLNGQWGVVDVDDCVNGALYLVRRGDADPNRLAIRGGSAGGYTTLNALTFRDVFQAGASYYGVSDLEALVRDTHKFESRYMDSMVGPYPEQKELYRERSSIHHADKLSSPVIFFQGLEDKVVPPSQAELMVAALRRKGLPVAYLTFEGEQHGFRKAETIRRTLEAELFFYSRIFGFTLPDESSIEGVELL